MRRVVTGDQIAQLRNPDPFAVPSWRSPVYRTPFVIVAVVQFARAIGWLIRFLVRNLVLVLAVIAGVLMWRVTGWLGLSVLAVSVTVVLVVWRWRFPVLFSRFIGCPGSGPVAGLALPPPLGRRNDDWPSRPGVSGPGLAARAGQGVGNRVHRPGTSTAGLGPVRGRLRRPGAQPGPRVPGTAMPRPHRLAGCAGIGVRPPRRPGRRDPRPGDPGPGGFAGAAGGQARGRPAVAGPRARHPRADSGRYRGREGLAAVVAGAGHAARHALRAGAGMGGRSQADGAGLRACDLRPVRPLRRHP